MQSPLKGHAGATGSPAAGQLGTDSLRPSTLPLPRARPPHGTSASGFIHSSQGNLRHHHCRPVEEPVLQVRRLAVPALPEAAGAGPRFLLSPSGQNHHPWVGAPDMGSRAHLPTRAPDLPLGWEQVQCPGTWRQARSLWRMSGVLLPLRGWPGGLGVSPRSTPFPQGAHPTVPPPGLGGWEN